jgi:putative addiction module component (TIGR02574 family)
LPREEREALYCALAESLGKPDAAVDEAWLDEAEDRLAAYDRGEIASVTLEEMIASRNKR